MTGVNERHFEDTIEAHLLDDGGYLKSDASNFDATLGLDTAEMFAYIGATQAKQWESLLGLYGNDSDAAQEGFSKRLATEIDSRGTVDVLRHGVIDLGVTLRLAFFKPAHGLTPELETLYEANRVTVTRQFLYESDSHKTIDIALLVNGIPTATAELKNPLTNQNIEDAIKQYRTDRDPANLTLSRRALVHFAVDPDRVAMTTKLAGQKTQFLPFNLGDNGGAGNPPSPHGHRTAYLWERVWTRDAWMDLLARFINVERPAMGSAAAKKAAERIIFPRYHQWDAVLSLEADAKANGAGKSYLVEHSAGSGKSNSIAWIAYRLSNLHTTFDEKVFDKVVVITDRRILDRQLQDTIYQFEHVHGVVIRIDKDSKQLGEALAGEQARIIISTIQKFRFILDTVADLPHRRYAVIVDEAHSSQTGESAKDLKLVLGSTFEQELTSAEAEDAGWVAEASDPVEEALAKAVKARGHQSTLSFFAFTATPKARTLEIFGTFDKTTKRYEPFHLYAMRQAIEEGFILDVLANYTTYKTYWKIGKTIAEDPKYEAPTAVRWIAKYVSLHPTNLAQKAEIIVEHFRQHTALKIGGKAKAMVVTSSRLHAVRYYQAINKYLADNGYSDVKALVAFSGKVIDEKSLDFTESAMNDFPESQTAEKFDTDEYQVLVVAEKFQTGFDQPLLHTMYVDKLLTGLAAVQTLSRLNRIHPSKDSTFVLDFRNEADDIVKAFEPYYGKTEALPTDPNLLYDTRHRLDEFDVLRVEEIDATVKLFLGAPDIKAHGPVYALLDKAVERFKALNQDDRLTFRDALNKFVRVYSFLSQVVSFGDSKLERDYIYCRMLAAKLRDVSTVESIDLGEEVELTHLKTAVTFQGPLGLEGEGGVISSGFGSYVKHEPPIETLSEIIAELNVRFGLNLDERDKLLFDQFEESWLADPEVVAQAKNNSPANFRLVFDDRFMSTVVNRMDLNEAIFKKILDVPEFRRVLMDLYASRVYRRAREEGEGA